MNLVNFTVFKEERHQEIYCSLYVLTVNPSKTTKVYDYISMFSMIFTKGDNFCDSLFASLYDKK